jgi:aryl-phospho-beta-D-glucosidase BglC (GH1 family)
MTRWLPTFVLTICLTAHAQTGSSLAFQRAAHLRHGINLSGWYAQSHDFSPAHMDAYMSVADMQQLKSLGFDHVRLSIDPEPLIAEAATGRLRPNAIARLDTTVAQLTSAGLNVILDIHAEQNWVAALAHGDDAPQRFYAFWTAFATHFAATDPDRVFFELMNEPTLDDLYRWQGIQARTVAMVRRVAPRHTIIATAAQWGGLDALLALEPVRDENVIYSFHDYDPMWFTHQGATWSTQSLAYLHNVPYPSTPENIQPILPLEPDERLRHQLERYGWDRWDAARIGAEIATVYEWAQHRGVPLYCGEFGVYKTIAPSAARAVWISDMRTALESKQISWAIWDYDGNFGLFTKESDAKTPDPALLHALGLAK